MKNGRFHKEGTIDKLKRDIGGFSIKLKLRNKNLNSEGISKSSCLNEKQGYDIVDAIEPEQSVSVTNLATSSLNQVGAFGKEQTDNLMFKDVSTLKKYFFDQYSTKCELKDEHPVSAFLFFILIFIYAFIDILHIFKFI